MSSLHDDTSLANPDSGSDSSFSRPTSNVLRQCRCFALAFATARPIFSPVATSLVAPFSRSHQSNPPLDSASLRQI